MKKLLALSDHYITCQYMLGRPGGGELPKTVILLSGAGKSKCLIGFLAHC